MNANKNIISMIVFLFCTSIIFSQKKEDVYFLMSKKNNEYLISGNLENLNDYIVVYNKKEYQYHKKKVRETKNNGTYSFDPESGRDNTNIYVSNITFEIFKKKKISINSCDFYKLRIVNYNWLLTEGWKQINGKDVITGNPLIFKDIYFLHKINRNEYIAYKVGMTVVDH